METFARKLALCAAGLLLPALLLPRLLAVFAVDSNGSPLTTPDSR
jgi:hypothetical protein